MKCVLKKIKSFFCASPEDLGIGLRLPKQKNTVFENHIPLDFAKTMKIYNKKINSKKVDDE